MADGNPFQGMLNPNMSRGANLWDLRMMSAANRMETPFERGARGMYRHQGVSGNPMLGSMAGMANEPDYSQFTFDPQAHAAATQALAPYGLKPLEASQVQQNAILPNTGFFGAHPRLSAALEGGIFGALASHGGETAGDSIQGALEGMVGGSRMRQGMLRQQFARPFEAAGMMENLQDLRQKRDLQEAEIQHMRATNQKMGRPDHAYSMHPLSKSDPGYVQFDAETGKAQYIQNPDYDPALVQRTGAGTDFDRFVDMRNKERAAQGKPPMNTQEILGLRGQWSASGVAPGEAARQPYKNLADVQATHKHYIQGLQNKLLQSDNPQHRQQAMSELLIQRMNSGNFNIPNDKDIKDYIEQNNKGIQQQIDASQQEFDESYPQTTTFPPEGSSPKRGQRVIQPDGSSPDRAIVIK